jgi:hypothetical protein
MVVRMVVRPIAKLSEGLGQTAALAGATTRLQLVVAATPRTAAGDLMPVARLLVRSCDH